ncbi:hypothetical protein PINS_up004506 [Pythium insidiosum]|nr:hypothetical protein PINS_up004506 [Pythium insidiosum]
MADASASASSAGTMLSASDFFGANDPEAADKFKTIALRALYDQKMEDELRSTRVECERLTLENATLATQLRELRVVMDNNIDDRERVLAFKSKRIEELLVKVKELEAINSSLLHTLRGGGKRAGPLQQQQQSSSSGGESDNNNNKETPAPATSAGAAAGAVDSPPPPLPSTTLNSDNAGRHTRASMQLLQRGEPLFHAVETCKELEYKRLLDEKRQHCDALQQQIESDARLVAEMRQFAAQKQDWIARIAALERELRDLRVERDDKVLFLERKLVFEHDRLSKEKAAELQACRDAMAQQMRTQLDVTTQQTIEENVRVQLELRYQSAQLERFVQQLDALRSEHRALQHEKRLVEEMNVTLSRKLKFFEQLFAKMQQRDQRQSRALSSRERATGTATSPSSRGACSPPPTASTFASFAPSPSPSSSPPNGRRRRPTRKPPLPALVLRSTGSAFALSSPSSPSTPSSPSPRRSIVPNPEFFARSLEVSPEPEQSEPQLTLDLSLLELDETSRDAAPLSSAASALDAHLLQREFSRKQVDAMLQHRHEQHPQQPEAPRSHRHHGHPHRHRPPRLVGRMHGTSPSRAGRKFREAPLTLQSFIAEQQQQQQQPRDDATDASALWRAPAASPSIHSARF